MRRGCIWALCLWLICGPLVATAQEFEQVNTTSPQTLENKTLVSPAISDPTITGVIGGSATITSPTITSPTISGTVAGGATYTGPTLTGPTITGTIAGTPTITAPTLTGPTITGTVLGGATYAGPTITDATMTGLKQLYANIETQDQYADINTAAAACVNKVLLITKAVTVATSVSFGSSCVVHMLEGAGSFAIDASQSVSLYHLVASAHYQIFSGAGCTTANICVNFQRGRTVYPEWWGAFPGASASVNQAAGTLAIYSLPTGAQGGGIVQWAVGSYSHDGSFFTNSRYLTVRGMGMYSTRLVQTSPASLKHGITCSGSTGYLGVEDLELSPSTPLTTDQSMKAINCNDLEGTAGGVDWTGAARTIVHVERFKSDGYNFGVYVDGGSSVLVHRAECINCIIKVHGANSSSIADPIIFQRVEWAFVDRSELECDASTCDHAVYNIQNIHNRVTNTKMSGFVFEAVKFITDAAHLTPDPLDWQVMNCEFRNNASDGVMTVTGSYTAESLVWSHNTHFANGVNNLADVYVQAHNGATIRKIDASHNYFDTIQAQAMKFEAAGTPDSTIDYVDATHTHVKTFSASASGTYVAVNYGGEDTMKYAVISGYFDGGTSGKRAHGLMQGGTGFQKVDSTGVFETGMAAGSVPPSPNLLQAEMGGSAVWAPNVQKAYCSLTATGNDANTSEKTLATFDLPANTLFTDNAGVYVVAWGKTSADANDKTIKYYFGGSSAILQNNASPSPNNIPFIIRSEVYRRSSGNQTYWATMKVGATEQVPAQNQETRDDTGAITIKVTGQSNSAGTANAVLLQGMCVYFLPPNPIW